MVEHDVGVDLTGAEREYNCVLRVGCGRQEISIGLLGSSAGLTCLMMPLMAVSSAQLWREEKGGQRIPTLTLVCLLSWSLKSVLNPREASMPR